MRTEYQLSLVEGCSNSKSLRSEELVNSLTVIFPFVSSLLPVLIYLRLRKRSVGAGAVICMHMLQAMHLIGLRTGDSRVVSFDVDRFA